MSYLIRTLVLVTSVIAVPAAASPRTMPSAGPRPRRRPATRPARRPNLSSMATGCAELPEARRSGRSSVGRRAINMTAPLMPCRTSTGKIRPGAAQRPAWLWPDPGIGRNGAAHGGAARSRKPRGKAV